MKTKEQRKKIIDNLDIYSREELIEKTTLAFFQIDNLEDTLADCRRVANKYMKLNEVKNDNPAN